MKKISVLICCLIAGLSLVLMTNNAQAISVNISDIYHGADDHGYGDVIGNAGLFGISSMDVNIVGTELQVKINTEFAGEGDKGHFASYTHNGKGIGYGDLFLSTNWNPSGTSGDNYISDDHDSTPSTKWTYGVKLDDNWGAGGSTVLYALNGTTNDDNAILTEDFFKSGVTFRNGQEALIDTSNTTDVIEMASNTGMWDLLTPGVLNITIDLDNITALLGPVAAGGELALHWGATCGNDVIEGSTQITIDPGNVTTPVPEPGTIALFGIGLAGFACEAARRRLRKRKQL